MSEEKKPVWMENDEEDSEDQEEELRREMMAVQGGAAPGLEAKQAINNEAGMLEKLSDISVEQPWVETLALTCGVEIPNEVAQDDLKRELAFYENSLSAIREAVKRFGAIKMPFRRPTDYYAEMLKTDEHMARIKKRLIADKKGMEDKEDRKREREIKKFAKQVQSEKLQEKAKKKKTELDAISKYKKERESRGDEDDAAALEPEKPKVGGKRARDESAERGGNKRAETNFARAAKDKKYGFGGGKKYAKSNNQESARDMRGWNTAKNRSAIPGVKGKGGGKAKSRPGKSRRK